MKKLSYNIGKSKKGLYCDINNMGQAYNTLLFLEAYSGRSKSGVIIFSTRKIRGYIKFTKDKPHDEFDKYYIPEKRVIDTHGVHFDIGIGIKPRVMWVKVMPKKSKP